MKGRGRWFSTRSILPCVRRPVNGCMARGAKRDQVLFGVVAGVTPKLFVMDFKVRHGAAELTPPSVAMQDLLAQAFVRQGVQPQGSGFGTNHSQDAFSRRFSRKACCCSPGKNLKYREIELSRISGSPLS